MKIDEAKELEVGAVFRGDFGLTGRWRFRVYGLGFRV